MEGYAGNHAPAKTEKVSFTCSKEAKSSTLKYKNVCLDKGRDFTEGRKKHLGTGNAGARRLVLCTVSLGARVNRK